MRFRSSAMRWLLASALVAGAVALGGCDPEQLRLAKSLKPLSAQMMALIEQKNMAKGSQILVRLFKEDAELEIWKQDQSGRFEHLKTYPVCRWSGELGPKVKEGDRQAPEGFYTITQANLNPNSQFHLSINIGYPNEFDRSWNRTGSALMIHGDCSSRGCYAMTNEQIEEIYALARESFFGGQRAFQIQAYPFRMTALNMAKHRNSPHMAFWRMLKQGNDHFEVSHQQPVVSVCDRKYVFDAQPPAKLSTPLKFNPAARCPAYSVDPDLMAAVNQKHQTDEAEFARLSRSTATVAVRTGRDGGMHPIFLAKVTRQIRNDDGTTRTVIDENAAAMLGSYVNPPRDPGVAPNETNTYVASAPAAAPPTSAPTMNAPAATTVAGVPMPRPAPHSRGAVPADTPSQTSGTVMSLASAESKPVPAPENPNPVSRVGSTMAKWIGIGGDDKKPVTAPAPKAAPAARTKHAPATPGHVPAAAANHALAAAAKHAPAATPATAKKPPTESAPPREARATNAGGNGILTGAQPMVSSDTFESRFAPTR